MFPRKKTLRDWMYDLINFKCLSLQMKIVNHKLKFQMQSLSGSQKLSKLEEWEAFLLCYQFLKLAGFPCV